MLVIGIGNVGRKDDGIGWAVLDQLREAGYEGPCEYRYQLNVEDAELVSHYERVLLVDASQESLEEGYRLERVKPVSNFSYSTHQLSPGAIAHLCQDLYGKEPEIWLLVVQGFDWGIGLGLSEEAKSGIERAVPNLYDQPALQAVPTP